MMTWLIFPPFCALLNNQRWKGEKVEEGGGDGIGEEKERAAASPAEC
jgi:hypothetical protein